MALPDQNGLNAVLRIVIATAVATLLAYAFTVSVDRVARGRPMNGNEKVRSFLAAIVGVVVIAFSALIAFLISYYSSFAVTGRLAPTMDADISNRSTFSLGPATAAAGFMAVVLICRKLRIARRAEKP
jgi:hypothetical protein